MISSEQNRERVKVFNSTWPHIFVVEDLSWKLNSIDSRVGFHLKKLEKKPKLGKLFSRDLIKANHKGKVVLWTPISF